MKKFSVAMLLLLTFAVAAPAVQAVEVSPMFTTNAVVQRDIDLPVWGWADPGTEITVEFAGQTVKTKTDKDGAWILKLKPLKMSKEPRRMVIKDNKNTISLENILVGDVWFCSGQSNMEWPVGRSAMPDFIDADSPMIRHIKFPHVKKKETSPIRSKGEDEDNLKPSPWTVCSKQNIGGFTAAGFFFAYTVNKEMDIPIGLIGCNWGGCRIEPWIPAEGFEVVKDQEPEKWPQKSEMYNGMGAVVVPYAIKGSLWYQGESNGSEGESYFWKTKALHEGWQKVWGQGEFPFYFVQLASFRKPNPDPAGGDGWAKVREAQRKCLTLPNTGMAVLTDIGEAGNIHPRNKYDVGRRLALWALAKDYGKKDLVYSGPLFKSAEFKDGKAIITFDHCKGLKAAKKSGPQDMTDPKPVDAVKGFAIAGADKKWVWADAKIEGDKVVLTSKEVKNPVAARYLFTTNTDHGTLYNGANLPAAPFRTDDW